MRKHFLQLDGMGVRDLHFCGDDLYLLAGPTMVLDGDIRALPMAGRGSALAANRETVRFESAPAALVDLPHGRGCNRAEAFCAVPPDGCPAAPRWLVLYDAPGADRRHGDIVFGDLLRGASRARLPRPASTAFRGSMTGRRRRCRSSSQTRDHERCIAGEEAQSLTRRGDEGVTSRIPVPSDGHGRGGGVDERRTSLSTQRDAGLREGRVARATHRSACP